LHNAIPEIGWHASKELCMASSIQEIAPDSHIALSLKQVFYEVQSFWHAYIREQKNVTMIIV